ncbi:alpha/beta fold hydrolase, partial [Robinsoniella sp.]|uniref:alpha/beta fold hydrolase n=1 Tax=Robinsoniella sp. TaxID=2496533 RepID=UPI0037515CF3
MQFPIIIGYYLCSFIAKFDKKALHNASVLGLMVKEPHVRPEMLAKITVPTMVIAGQHDMIKEQHTKLIAHSIPKAQLKIIPGATHFVFGKWADETNHMILTFLKTPPKH